MCGIVGFVGDNALLNVLEGLATLEYRGYDSAGVAYDHFGLKVLKREGRLINVSSNLDIKHKTIPRLAIGHTRWATHGAPNETNAHPHVVGDIAIVHNGIIENYKELISKFNLKLRSETDSEVIAHLLQLQEGPMEDRLKKVMEMLSGSFAVAVIDAKQKDKIFVCRKDSPLIVATGVIASDVDAMVGLAEKAITLNDYDIAIVSGKGEPRITNTKGYTKSHLSVRVPKKLPFMKQDRFDTHMEREIFAQPRVLQDAFNNNRNMGQDLSEYGRITFTACGTSLHACMLASKYLRDKARIHSDVVLASELRFGMRHIGSNDLVVAVSQSGETADTLAVVRKANENFATTLAVTNKPHSSLAREATDYVDIFAGPEYSVASTKAFLCQLSLMYMLADKASGRMIMSKMSSIHAYVERVLQKADVIKEASEIFKGATSAFYLGRGYGVAVAYEGALKLKEISYIHAEGYPAGELKHGPIALIEEGTPVVAIANNSIVYDKVVANIEELRARGAKVIAIATENNFDINKHADFVITTPAIEEEFAPFITTAVTQLLAFYTAKARGLDVDMPRNLAKSVTVE